MIKLDNLQNAAGMGIGLAQGGRSSQRSMQQRGGWKNSPAIGSQHDGCQYIFRQYRQYYRARQHVFLVKAFVKPDGMPGSRMQWRRPDDGDVFVMPADHAGIADDVAGIGMAFEIVEGLYGKENAIHPEKEYVIQ